MSHHNNSAQVALALAMVIFLATACVPQQGSPEITEITWQWSALTENQPAAQSVVPHPENYTLFLGTDGSLKIKADCNMVGGSYTLENGSLTIDLGPATMAFCGEQSLDLQFLELLVGVQSVSLENEELILHLENDAGQLIFTN